MVMYGVSFAAFSSINEGFTAVKLGHRAQMQISRVAFFTGEVALVEVRGTQGERGTTRFAVQLCLRMLLPQQTANQFQTKAPPCLFQLLLHAPLQDVAQRAAMQAALARETDTLDTIYTVHLYGGRTLQDSLVDGALDYSAGALFRSSKHAQVLFRTEECLRSDADACAVEGSPMYAVTHSGVDPMMRRTVEEARLLSRDNASAITPDASNTR